MSELTEAYKVMQRHCGIEPGDTVRVLRGFKHGEMGCDGLDSDSANYVGETCLVELDCSSWFHTRMNDGVGMHYPFFCLELVKKAKSEPPAGVIFEGDGLTVAPSKRDTFVSKDTIKRNLDL